MDRTRTGRLMIVAGLLVFLAGLIGVATGGSSNDAANTPPPATTPSTTSTTAAPAAPVATTTSTTTSPPTSAPIATTTVAPTTVAPTTTVDPNSAVASFITQFAADIAGTDTPALMATLNPAVILGSGEQFCRDFVNREILALSNYQLIGPVNGPVSKPIQTIAGNVTVDNIYVADVSFDFGGQTFPSKADFVLSPDGVVSWLATCR